jgi:LacI family transcriptional regulator
MKKKIVIKDIAEQLNISKTAVSFVLNGKAREHGISIKLEAEILKYVEEVGYRPNTIAQGLRTGKTKIIGMTIEDISDPFFSLIARMVEERAYAEGYRIIYGSTENDTTKTKDMLRVFRNHQVDGYILAPPPGVENDIRELLDEGFPVVIYDRTIPGIEVDTIIVDNHEAAYQATKHLIDNGYNNIAMITLVSEQLQMMDRQNGYEQMMQESDRPALIKRIIYHDKKEHCIKEIEDFLKKNRSLDAVFFATNYIAENGLEAIRNIGLNIPDDLAVIVFDDYTLFRLYSPAITAVSQPINEIADHVVSMMLNRLGSTEQIDPRKIVLKTKLVTRSSTRPLL